MQARSVILGTGQIWPQPCLRVGRDWQEEHEEKQGEMSGLPQCKSPPWPQWSDGGCLAWGQIIKNRPALPKTTQALPLDPICSYFGVHSMT